MTTVPSTVQPRYARPGANPTLETLEYIHSALSAAGGPVSRNWVLGVLASWGHTTTRRSLNAGLQFLASMGTIGEADGGIVLFPTPSRSSPPVSRQKRSV